uniref:Uncharacterized protein n=1 Tax=Arundo donax TaxID=35708 RepID=A0A0A9DYM7_ARUDO
MAIRHLFPWELNKRLMFTLISLEDVLHSWLTLIQKRTELSLSVTGNMIFLLGQLVSYLTARMWCSTLQRCDLKH